MVRAIRPKSSQVQALKYMVRRYRVALKRRGLKSASDAEKKAFNEIYLLINDLTGQKLLF